MRYDDDDDDDTLLRHTQTHTHTPPVVNTIFLLYLFLRPTHPLGTIQNLSRPP